MANETHTLKLGSTSYPIYSEGVLLNATTSNSSYPLVFSSDIAATTNNGTSYKKLYTDTNKYFTYKLGDITPQSDSHTLVNSTNKLNFGDKSFSTDKYWFDVDPSSNITANISGETLNSDQGADDGVLTIKPGESIIIPASTLDFKICYTDSIGSDYGPYSYKLPSNFYSLLVIVDTANNSILKVSAVQVGTNSVHKPSNTTEVNMPSGLAGTKVKGHYSFWITKSIPQVSWENLTSSNVKVKIMFYPIYTNATGKDGSTQITISDLYATSNKKAYTYSTDNKSISLRQFLLEFAITGEKIKYLKKDTLSNLSNSTSYKIAVAKNGLWLGNNMNQIRLSTDASLGAAIQLWSPINSIKFTANGSYPGIEVTSTKRINDSVPPFNIKLPSSGSLVLACDNATTYFRPSTTGYGYLGHSSYIWHSMYANNVYKGTTSLTTSDERYKNFIDDIDIDFDKLKSIPKKTFTWKKGSFYDGNKIYLGTSAQKVKEIYPELVNIFNADVCDDINSDDAILGVDYEKLSVVALAAIDKLHERLETLETEFNIVKEERDNIKEKLIISENKYLNLEKKLIDMENLLNKINS